MNQTLTKSLLKLVNVNKDNWDLLIDPVLFAYRTSKHDSTKYTPFFMMYKREAKLPIELAIPSRPEEGESTTHELSLDEKIEHMTKLKKETKSKASSNIEKAQERQKKNYDKKHKPVEFEVGDKVLLRNSRDDARKGGKLQAPWGKGTYTIAECLPKNLYRLKNEQGNELSKKYNSARLKPYVMNEKVNSQPTTTTPTTTTTRVEPLNDNDIEAAQNILRRQFSNLHGLQDPCLKDARFAVMPNLSVQIHHTGNFHWVYSIGDMEGVYLLDSLYNNDVTPSTEIHLSLVYKGHRSRYADSIYSSRSATNGVSRLWLICNCFHRRVCLQRSGGCHQFQLQAIANENSSRRVHCERQISTFS